jgi:hypothetical protein
MADNRVTTVGTHQHLSGAVESERTCLCRHFEARLASKQEI